MRGRKGKTVVGVITVIDEEFKAAQTALGATQRFGTTQYFHEPSGPDRFVLVKQGDRGNVPAEKTASALIEHWQPEIVLLVGIAGALVGGGASLGDVVVADYIHYGDFRKLTEGQDALRFAAYDQPTVSLREVHLEPLKIVGGWSARLTAPRPVPKRGFIDWARARPAPAPGKSKIEIGAIVAGEKVVGDPDHPEQARLFVTFDNAAGVDMESFGFARAVHDARFDPGYNPRMSVIRGISDMVERKLPAPDPKTALRRAMPARLTGVGTNNEQRKVWKRYAAAAAAAFAAEVVDECAP